MSQGLLRICHQDKMHAIWEQVTSEIGTPSWTDVGLQSTTWSMLFESKRWISSWKTSRAPEKSLPQYVWWRKQCLRLRPLQWIWRFWRISDKTLTDSSSHAWYDCCYCKAWSCHWYHDVQLYSSGKTWVPWVWTEASCLLEHVRLWFS